MDVFSMYTVENVPPSEHSQDIHRNCLLFFYNYSPGYNYYWNSCSATFNSNPALLCSNKYISEDNPVAKIHNRSDVIWAQAVENCIVARKFPASIQSIENGNFTNQHEQDHWTGIIRKESIISLNDMLDKSTNPPLKYAYVELINRTSYVRFAHEGESRKSLCIGGSTAGLAVGLSVSMALLIIVTIIVLMFLKRKGLPKRCYTRNGEKGNHNEDTKTEISFVPAPILESSTYTMNYLTASNHSYFVLEKTYKRETREETEDYGEPDTTDVDHYDSIGMSQNDTFNNYDMSALAEPYNIYNKVDLYQSDEYDHIHQNGKPPKSDRQTENEYDISNNLIDGKLSYKFGNDSETYNHLNIHDMKSSGTDNVYGKTETDGDSGYDTSHALNLRRNKDANDQQADYAVIKKDLTHFFSKIFRIQTPALKKKHVS
ncbi:hypothetical protein MAR_014457 [Mya arenaria]|uniref:Uncharacterized protein n=1 Tax=Mya arenaria TaxID=6604 RepID=A0ABY7G2S1_MYAAR|nr:hypothetical protein MAR_014457 [Mya arenaria]